MLRPAFVVTLAAAALHCDRGSKTQNPPPPRNPPEAVASAEPSSSASHSNPPAVASADPNKRKRAVRDPLPKQESLGKTPPAGKAVSPRDADGRTIYARADGHCFVNVPPKTDAPKPATKHPAPVIALVDCPDAMNDPAWDTCLGGRMRQVAADDCFCRVDGNPPPPPWKAECPKGPAPKKR